MQIDFEGLSQRIIAIPNVPERQYLDLQACVDGQVFYMEAPRPAGVGGGGGGGGGNELMRYRLCERRATTFANNVAAYEISADRRKLVYRAGGGGGGQVWWSRWRRWYSTSSTVVPRRCGSHSATSGLGSFERFTAHVSGAEGGVQTDLQRRLATSTRLPLRAKHAGHRLAQDEERYWQMLPYVMHRADLNYLLDIMGAEIAVGHSYVRGGDMPTVPQPVAGLLGADFVIDQGRYKVTRIYDNESWNPDLR